MISTLSTANLVLSESESDTTDVSAPSSYNSVITPNEESMNDSLDESIEIICEVQPCSHISEIPLITSGEGQSDIVSGIVKMK